MKRTLLLSLATIAASLAVVLPQTGMAQAPTEKTLAQAPTEKTFYVLRHAESAEALLELGKDARALLLDCRPFLNEGVIENCCTEVLDTLGETRAQLLAKWFRDQGLLPTLTHVFATHKVRTLQTVQPIAHAAGLDKDRNGDGTPDGSDIDLSPGDGVQQIPATVQECERGFEIAHNFYGLTVDALKRLPLGSGAVVCGHSASVYPIMQSFGIDTSDARNFPRSANGRVRGFNNLWIVSVDGNNVGRLVSHIQLDFAFVQRVNP